MNAAARIIVALGLITLVPLTGCGLGSSSLGSLIPGNGNGQPGGNTKSAAVKVDINWSARSRAVNAPSSAQSAVFTLAGAKIGGGDFIFAVDRADAPAAYTQTAVSAQQALVGNWNMTVQFYGSKAGQGTVVATASKAIALNTDGTGIGDVTATPTIATAAVVLPNQSLSVGKSTALSFTAMDASGKAVTVTPGSAFFAVTSGGDKLQVAADGTVKALAAGSAAVTVTIDGKTSAPQSIEILPSLTSFEAPTPGQSIADASAALTSHLAQAAATIPSAALIAQTAGQVGITSAFASQTRGFLDLANGAAPVKTGSGVYTWTQTSDGLTITFTLDESQAQTAQWKVTLSGTLGGQPINNATYVSGSYKRDTLNGKVGYHENITYSDFTGTNKTVATDDVYLFDDGTAQASLNLADAYLVSWEYRADKSWYFAQFQNNNGTQQKVAEAVYKVDGTGSAKSFSTLDNAVQSEVTYTANGAHGTITEHTTASGGTEGKQSSW